MFQKTLSALVIAAVLALGLAQPAAAASREEKLARHAEKVKAGIAKLGASKQSRVSLELRDKTKRAGYVAEIGDDSFVVVDEQTSVATQVAYPDVAKVKGHNMSTGAKIAIGTAIGVGVTLLVIFLIYLNNEQ